MRILFLSGREIEYQRNTFVLNLLKRFGHVDEFQSGFEKFVRGSILRRTLLLYAYLSLKKTFNYDLIFVGFYGHLLAISLHHTFRAPVIFDAFISTYDTLCFDRKTFSPKSIFGRLAYWLDKKSCEFSDIILLDTPQHIEYFVEEFNLNQKKFFWLPVGCDENIFFPRKYTRNTDIDLRVLCYSTYLPLHGMDIVIRAAHKLLVEKHIKFQLVGNGQEFSKIKNYIDKNKLTNVTLLPPVTLPELPTLISESDVILGGHFGNSNKAQRVIPGKVYQVLAMQKPLIAGDTSANRTLLSHGENSILVPPNNPELLAEAILQLRDNEFLRDRISENGRLLFEEKCSVDANTDKMREIISYIQGML
ncbi:glycosyltransferase [Bellilinea sp.]|uniref:glycosyltransferase n=1 Tax=Bellilinea sp. TaxID=2838785 RepID=UPI002ADE93F2|nr:glycosyltransferase [Bellilinea sp.]